MGQNDDLLVLFSGEKPPLDNSMTSGELNAPRNIGFVKVSPDRTSIAPILLVEQWIVYNIVHYHANIHNNGIIVYV